MSSSPTIRGNLLGLRGSAGMKAPGAAQAPSGDARPGSGGLFLAIRAGQRTEDPPLFIEAGASGAGRSPQGPVGPTGKCPRQGASTDARQRKFFGRSGAWREGPVESKDGSSGWAVTPQGALPSEGYRTSPWGSGWPDDGSPVQPLSVLGVWPAPEASGVSWRTRSARFLGRAHLTPRFLYQDISEDNKGS